MDVFVTLPPEVGMETFDQFGQVVHDRFPDKKPRHSVQGFFHFNLENSDENKAASVSKHAGYIFRSASKDRAVQARVDGFTFNRLRVYEGWTRFSAEARELWGLFVKLSGPVVITRIGLRYLNRIELPIGLASFQDYCLLFPGNDALPNPITGFITSYSAPSQNVPNAETSVSVSVQKPPPTKAVIPLVIDISIGVGWNQPAEDESFWAVFETMRVEKNLMFERSITDRTRELFR